MTLTQLKYVLMVDEKKTISEASKALFISQPSLSAAIKELEKELGITIFHRTNKGIMKTLAGEEFLGYARQVMDQMHLIEEKYVLGTKEKQSFCVSAQHYSFVVEAFVDVLKTCGQKQYDFRIRETQTYEIIEDVATLKSELGVLYRNTFNASIIDKELLHHELTFHSLINVKPHVFLSNQHPLSKEKKISLKQLAPYPRLSYEQGKHNAFYFSEEILSTLHSNKDIVVRDRATLFNLLIGLDGYTICSGIISKELNGDSIIALPLDVDDTMEIGYITHNRVVLSYLGKLFIEKLKKHVLL